MFDKLENLLLKYEELGARLSQPDAASDPVLFRQLMKEQSDLEPIVSAYIEYKKAGQTVNDSLAMLDEESDEEMRTMLKEELASARDKITELEGRLKILLLPPPDSSFP